MRALVKLVCVLPLMFITAPKGQLSSGSDVTKCPPHLNRGGNLIAFHNTCYDVVTYDPLTWEDARVRCQTNGGRLVEIAGITTLSFLTGYLSTLDNVGTGVWIGLDDKDQEGLWRWDSGPPLKSSHWGPEQPGGFTGWLDDCALMKLDGFWYDYQCDVFYQHFSYICQYDMLK
ncbi:hypothetical protein V1264_007046 [Littorina saxatilis]